MKVPKHCAERRRAAAREISFDSHGRLGASAQAVIKRFAHLRASALGLSVSAEVQRWYACISISLLRGNHRILSGQSAPSRGRPTTAGRQGYLDLAMV